MNKAKLSILIMLFLASVVTLTSVNVQFKDVTNTTKTILGLEYPGGVYPNGTHVGRFKVVFYNAGLDGIIDPLGADGAPTGDDFLINNGANPQDVTTAPVGQNGWTQTTGYTVPETGTVNTLVGHSVYCRIFNSSDLLTATKFIVPATAYLILPSPTVQNPSPVTLGGWSAWTPIQDDPAEWTISGAITTLTGTLDGVTIAATGIDAANIEYDGTTGLYTVTVEEGWTGTITPDKAGAQFVPASRAYNVPVAANVVGDNFVMQTVVAPGIPQNLSPNGTPLDFPVPTPVTLMWDAPATGTVEGYKLVWNDGAPITLGADVTEWTTDPLTAGAYTWKVLAFNNTTYSKSGKTIAVNTRAKANDRSVANAPKADGTYAEAAFNVTITPYTITLNSDPVGAEIYQGEVLLGVAPQVVDPAVTGTYTAVLAGYTFEPFEVLVVDGNIVHTFMGTADVDIIINPNEELPPNVVVGGPIPPALLGPDLGLPAQIYTVTATGTHDVTVFKPLGWTVDWYCWIFANGSLIAGPNPIPAATLSNEFLAVDFGATKGDAQIIINDNQTLPVELSSFNAVLTAQYFVKLTWISQSETNLNGYRVYRSENTELVNATMITPIIISATNTSSTQVYSIEDREVAFGNTYWYWLESVENDGSSNFHGPTSVFVEGEVPPVLPQATTMRSAYPNPFKAASTTTIEVAVKEGESGTLTIYNVLGQVVKTYSLNQGIHNLKWNGKDSKGNICSSGIYFYKLSTPTMNQTKKMVIVK